LVGASVISCGISEACCLVAKLLGDEFEPNWDSYSELWNTHITFSSKQPLIGRAMLSSIEVIESSIGYTFNNKIYLAQALVHSSFSGAFECYQRLEFLGTYFLHSRGCGHRIPGY
jgi:hypothetical protein